MMNAQEYEKAYFGLIDVVDRDPGSLSYTAIVKDVVFLAMDDNAVDPGGHGEFSAATMQWIGEMLDKYRGVCQGDVSGDTFLSRVPRSVSADTSP